MKRILITVFTFLSLQTFAQLPSIEVGGKKVILTQLVDSATFADTTAAHRTAISGKVSSVYPVLTQAVDLSKTSADLTAAVFNFYKRGTTGNANGAIVDGTDLGSHFFYGWDGIAFGVGSFAIATTTQNWTTSAHGSDYSIFYTPTGSTTQSLGMLIDDAGVRFPKYTGGFLKSDATGKMSGVSVTSADVVNTRRAVADAATTMQITDYMIAYTSLTAARVVTIGAASSYAGRHFIIKDESGSATSTLKITIAGTINGAVNPTAVSSAYGVYKFYSNGTAWFTE